MSLMKEQFGWYIFLEVVKQLVVAQSERKTMFIDCKYDPIGFEPLQGCFSTGITFIVNKTQVLWPLT